MSKYCLTMVPIFNHLNQEQMKKIMPRIKEAKFKKNELIYSGGDASDTLYVVRRGRIKLYRLSASGKEQLIAFLNPGEFTGELALFREGTYGRFAEATMETECCTINRKDLQEFLLEYPTIALKLLQEFSNRIETSEKQQTSYATEKVETRIAMFILESLDSNSTMVELDMSKKDMASYLGTTPETISRKLKEFESAGLIKSHSNKKIEVLDEDELLFI